jgi:hypothetical protein
MLASSARASPVWRPPELCLGVASVLAVGITRDVAIQIQGAGKRQIRNVLFIGS